MTEPDAQGFWDRVKAENDANAKDVDLREFVGLPRLLQPQPEGNAVAHLVSYFLTRTY